MPTYLNQSDEPSNEDRLGVLLVNLGTPDALTVPAIRRFLAEFLWDPRVIEAPRWLWWLALHGFILRVRPSRSLHAYRQIWTDAGSPLLIHSEALTRRVAALLRERLPVSVALGMTYGSPSIAQALAILRREGMRRLIVLPLFPQYSGTTTASVFDRVTGELQRWRRIPELRFISGYHDEPAYIEAIAESVRRRRPRTERSSHLLFSFHGIPQRYVRAGDPYYEYCMRSARLIADKLGLAEDAWTMSFQSQVGREEWLRPYTNEWLAGAPRKGIKHVTVACPGFATDCLETLEEIAIRNRATFLEHGGETYEYVPALNEAEEHAKLLADLILRHATQAPSAIEPTAAASAPRVLGHSARN
ncbi:MAG TPA: ferrochelatase [Steroidobacteraceae bacterium]